MSIISNPKDIEFLRSFRHQYIKCVSNAYSLSWKWNVSLPSEHNQKLSMMLLPHLDRMVDIVYWMLIWLFAQTNRRPNLNRIIREEEKVAQWDARTLLVHVYEEMEKHLAIVVELLPQFQEDVLPKDDTNEITWSYYAVIEELERAFAYQKQLGEYLSIHHSPQQ